MRQIPIYKAERELGLAELISSNNSLSYLSVAKAANISEGTKSTITSLPAIQNFAKSTNQNQIDLFYMNDIMVSCGWNDNYDVFLKEEMWVARNTPTDKPLNLEHSPREIIGHITDQFALNAKGELISDDTCVDDLPDSFDILNNTVIYRFHNDKEYKKKIDKIIEEITTSDKWKVSMEALFTDYDYAIEDGNDTVIIARSSKTAFLTQHLKAYKGTGTYQGKKLGRVLKNIVFCGKGLTDNPANPKSVINGTQPFTVKADKNNSTFFDLGYTNLNEGDIKMNEQEMKTKLAEAELTIANSKVEIEKLSNIVKEKAALEASLNKANENLTSVAAKVAELEKVNVDTKASLEAKNKEFAELNDKFVKADAELSKINAENMKNVRINTMVNDLKMVKESAVELYETLATLNDTQFASYVEKSKKLLTPANTETVTATKVIEGATPEKVEAPVVPDTSKVNETAGKIKNFIKASKGVAKQGDK